MCCVQSLGKSRGEAKVLGLEVAGHKDAVEDYEEQLSNTETRITAVHSSFCVLGDKMGAAQACYQLVNSYAPKLRCLKAGLCAEDRTYVNVCGEFQCCVHWHRRQQRCPCAAVTGLQVAEPFTSKLVAGKEVRARNVSGKCAR